jgi:hypothetical protein
MVLATCVAFSSDVHGQTASTGALAGSVLDSSGAVIPGVEVQLVNQQTADDESVTSDNTGSFSFPLLVPGNYDLRATKSSFEVLQVSKHSCSRNRDLAAGTSASARYRQGGHANFFRRPDGSDGHCCIGQGYKSNSDHRPFRWSRGTSRK